MNRTSLPSRLLGVLLALLCLGFGTLPALAAEDSASFEAEHACTVYDYFSGLPYTEANVTAQTPDGFLYIGSYGGLTRFDGQRFEAISGISSAVCLYVDRQGRLWVGTNEMGAVCLEGGALTFYNQADGLPSDAIRGFCQDPNGDFYIATVSGLVMLEAEGTVLPVLDERLRTVSVTMLSGAPSGVVYGVTVDGNAFSLQGRSVVHWWSAEEIGADVGCIYADPGIEGRFWCGTEGSEVLCCAADQPVSQWERYSTAGISGVNCLLLEEDRLWVCCGDGMGWLDPQGAFHPLTQTPFKNAIEHVLLDLEGNLWFSSSRRGVMKVSKSRFTDVNLLAGLEAAPVNGAWVEGGIVYLGGNGGLVTLDQTGARLETAVSVFLEGVPINAILGDGQGSLWFCTDSSLGLVRYSLKTGALTPIREADGLPSNYVLNALALENGDLMIYTPGGLSLIREGTVTRTWGREEGLFEAELSALCQTPEGAVLLGTNGQGLYLLEDDAIRPFYGLNELQSPVILGLWEDPARQCVWVSTGSGELGVLRAGELRSRSGVLPAADHSGSPFYDLLVDGKNLWLLGSTGLYVTDGDLLLAGEAQTGRFYDRTGGLPHVTAPASRSCLTAERVAWLCGSDGVTRVDLGEAEASAGKPQLAVPWVEVDEERILLTPGQTLELASNCKRLRLHAAAITFALEDPELLYRLEGYEDQWTYATAGTLSDVVYTNLGGGDYLFRFGLPGGADGEPAAEFTLRIHKTLAFYEEPAVWIGALLLILLLLAGGIWLLLRRQQRILEGKQEEARINNELNLAAKIQMDMLPTDFRAFPNREEFDIEAMMHPAKEVGGDFYDFFPVDEDHLAITVADVSGKGVPAALFMMISMALLKSEAKVRVSPARVLEEVNAKLAENNPNNMFVTVWLGILELSTGLLTWADGGHEELLLYQDGAWRYVEKHKGVALALLEPELLELEEDPPFVDQELHLRPGDLVFQYTDGVPEATDAKDQLFGQERLLEALQTAPELEPRALLDHVKARVNAYVGPVLQFDDITMLALKYRGPK